MKFSKKAEGAQTNTRICTIEGVKSSSISTDKGYVEARFTSDELGETISLKYGDIQIIVPFEPIMVLVNETRWANIEEI